MYTLIQKQWHIKNLKVCFDFWLKCLYIIIYSICSTLHSDVSREDNFSKREGQKFELFPLTEKDEGGKLES